MRPPLTTVMLAIVLLAGCASPEPSGSATPAGATPTVGSPTAAVTPPATSAPAASSTPAPASAPVETVKLGVVLDETHVFQPGGPRASFFNVTGGESQVVIDVTSAGPPPDRSFTSAVVHFYYPRTTSPFVAELPGQEARNFTMALPPHDGMWRVNYDGVGNTSVHVRVTLR